MFFSHHDDHDIIKKGARNAFGAFAYITAVALFMASLHNPDSPDSPEIEIMAPIGMLMLLVLSAAVMALLIFGGPVMLYIDGKKKDAVRLVAWTISSLAALTVCTLIVMTTVSG